MWGPCNPCPKGSPSTTGFSGPLACAKSCITLTLRHPECEGWGGPGAPTSTSQPPRSHLGCLGAGTARMGLAMGSK